MADSAKGEQRRRAAVEAALRLIARGGIGAASVRHVAAEAGMSPGALRHFFPTQEQLLEHVMTEVTAAAAHRIVPRIRDLDRARTTEDGIDAACALLEELLPLDERRRIEWFLWSAVAHTASHLVILERWRSAGWLGVQHQCRRVVGHLHGRPVPDVAADGADVAGIVASTAGLPQLDDPAEETRVVVLHAGLDGLAVQLTADPAHLDPQAARRALRELVTLV